MDFFDRNSDGSTTVPETYKGLRALGLGRVLSGAAAVGINLGLACKTGAAWYSLTINNDNIHKAKHDSDSDVYDAQGNYDAAKFEEMFQKHDANKDAALDKAEIDAMLERNKETKVGRLAFGAEFGLLLSIAGQENQSGEKVLSRARMESLYDGSLFFKLAEERA
ncbi:hypothetical protein IV102_30115 [bacterium]|nr:hypothetical protein [bacterium]